MTYICKKLFLWIKVIYGDSVKFQWMYNSMIIIVRFYDNREFTLQTWLIPSARLRKVVHQFKWLTTWAFDFTLSYEKEESRVHRDSNMHHSEGEEYRFELLKCKTESNRHVIIFNLYLHSFLHHPLIYCEKKLGRSVCLI